MRKINAIFTDNNQVINLAKNVYAHQQLQQFWLAAAPKNLSQSSFVSNLNQGQITVYADSAIVANKIKLTQASLLTQMQDLQKNNPLFSVKVQVKSHPKPVIKTPRRLSASAAINLKTLAQDLGESPLAEKLNSLANKT
jgi:hypothetical protein